MSTRLRPEVELCRQTDQCWELIDHATGLHLEVEGDLSKVRERAVDGLAPESLELLQSLGLLDEQLPLEQIRARQRGLRVEALRGGRPERVRELLAFALERVPYYRERAELYRPDRIEDERSLASLPLMRKADLRAHFPDGLLAQGLDVPELVARGALEFASTSGTTGERLQVLADMELSSVPDDYEALWGLSYPDRVPKTAVFTTPVCLGNQCHLGRAPYAQRLRGENTLYLNSLDDLFSLKRELVEAIALEMHRFQPDFLLVNPFYLHWLGRRARELQIELPKPKLILTCYQYLSDIQRHALQGLFGAPVYNYYFATDLSGCRIAIECPRGRWHVREDHVLLEVVGPEGLKPPGALGTFALTSHANRVMPLVRYVVGDLGRLTGEACDCAVSEWECLEMHGRLKDLVRFGERWVTTRELDLVVSRIRGIDFYKAVQTGERQLRLEVVPALDAPFEPAEAEANLRAAFELASVQVVKTKRLDPEASLKFRITQSQFLEPPELL